MGSEVLAVWSELDASRALHPADHEVIRSTEAARSLVVDLFAGHPRDLFNACARLGGLMAEGGASPSLAAGAIDTVERAFAKVGIAIDPARIPAARASLLEGYVAGIRDGVRGAGLAAWEYPACAVPLEPGVVAIACGYPDDDGEGLEAWASRIAGQLVRAKAKQAILAGREPVKAELASALALVGVEIANPETRKAVGWLRLPWSRR